MTPPTATPPPRPSIVARFGPFAVVLAALAALTVVASVGDGGDEASAGTTAPIEPGDGASRDHLPITWDEAAEAGTTDDYEWNEHCDPETGRVAIPSNHAPPCVALREPEQAENGGETYQGVTADSIKVVLYESADDDLAAALQDQSDSREAVRDTREKLLRLFEDRFETWGRKLEIVHFKGSGSDETSARADAVRVATEIGAFASIGGPAQEDAYAIELASRGVLCIGCGLAMPDSSYQDLAPYVWGAGQSPEQFLLNVGDFVVQQLMGKPAEFAGDPAMREQERVFGSVHFEQDPPVFTGVREEFRRRADEVGLEIKVTVSYQLVISELAEKARSIVATLKDAGVTTVIFLGDPLMPMYLTQAATDQGYFPEWVITGTVLTDTTTFGRLYDQRQWAHAFGVAVNSARGPIDTSDAWRLHEWFYGEPPAAAKSVRAFAGTHHLFMLGIHMAGPNLTPETFRDGLFSLPPLGGTPVAPRWSFGHNDFFQATDYTAIDDMAVVWWDAEATGPDEQGNDGTGMMRFVEGGRRYLPGELGSDDLGLFEEEGSVTVYDEIPADQLPPSYPPPR